MEQKWRGWRADIFSRVEKRKTHVNIRSKKKEKKRKTRKKGNIFLKSRKKINFVDVFVPWKRDSISKPIDRLREKEKEREEE